MGPHEQSPGFGRAFLPLGGAVYFVYILYCPATGLSYVGQTNHLVLRYYEHRDGLSRWTRRMVAPLVVHWETFPTRSEAVGHEKYYKRGSGFRVRQDIINRFVADGGCSSVG